MPKELEENAIAIAILKGWKYDKDSNKYRIIPNKDNPIEIFVTKEELIDRFTCLNGLIIEIEMTIPYEWDYSISKREIILNNEGLIEYRDSCYKKIESVQECLIWILKKDA